ncbi:putative Fungal-specific transcription factor domain-containing protein [Seiridium cardinale]|uniref:Fungal-specific transcription factor domain-containing protein n=1 Tax=Seiridium cardinale TaxID=138064 RepID=A0ABR2XJI7_9PEZI
MSTTSSGMGKSPRVLACVLCQHRKIKCDRHSPCSNCLKAGVTCTPSTPAPARKRRRPNQDLQQRLARCEELLQEYATAKPPSTGNEPSSPEEPWKSMGKLVVDDDGVRFMDSFLWATVHDEVRAMREIIDQDEKEEESSSTTPADGLTPDHHTGLLFSNDSDANLDELYPNPTHVFRLWHTFLERVNPITKVIHVPTVQPLVVEAATNMPNLPKNVEALLFSIYTLGVVAMTESECIAVLGQSKDDAFARFSKGARISFMRAGILHKYDLVVLQALVLYLTSLMGRYDRHAAWILNGVIIRIAQKMGLHRDGELLGLSPFDTEMRRRVWWQIILLDAVYAMMSGFGQSMLPRHWNTKEPSNVNDADLFPTMTKVESKEGPTDMILCLISYEIARLLSEFPGLENVILQNELATTSGPATSEIQAAQARINELDESIGEILRKYGDPSMGPLHELAALQGRNVIEKLRELIRPPREQPEWGTEVLTPKDNLFKIAVSGGEHSLETYRQVASGGTFMWFVKIHFQVEVFQFLIGQLCSRTSGQLVDRAWAVVEDVFRYHGEFLKLSIKPHAALALVTIKAWRKREEALRLSTGGIPETPWYITRLRELLGPGYDVQDSGSEATMSPSTQSISAPGTSSSSADMPWDQMLGFVDSPAMSWDIFGQNSQPAVNYSAYSTGMGPYPTMNGWM